MVSPILKLLLIFSLNDSISTAVVSTSPVKKTVIITGANRGIGFNACKQLASTNEWSIIMACRSKSDAQKAVSSIPISKGRENVEIMQLDLADFNSIKTFSDQIIKSNRPINVLACNAGIQLSSNPTGKDSRPVKRTANGFEATVGTNHIGHFYLTQLLLKTLGKQKGSRVAFVGSGVHNPEEAGGDVGSKATLGDMSGLVAGFKDDISMVDGSSYDADKAYKDSKLCNVITALELARRLKSQRSDITSNVMNPGLIPTTGLFRELNPIFVTIFTFLTRYVFKVAVSEEEGGRRLAFMISSPSLNGLSGLYYTGKAGKSEFVPYEPSKEAQDQKKAKLFWEYSMKLIPRL